MKKLNNNNRNQEKEEEALAVLKEFLLNSTYRNRKAIFFDTKREIISTYGEAYYKNLEEVLKKEHDKYFNDLPSLSEEKIDLEPLELPIRKSKMAIFKYLLPTKRREEVLGDLQETRFNMERDGVAPWKIRLVMLWQMVLVVVALQKVKISDFGQVREVE